MKHSRRVNLNSSLIIIVNGFKCVAGLLEKSKWPYMERRYKEL